MFVRYEINALRFDEKSFFRTVLISSPHWDYERYDESFSEKKKKFKYNKKNSSEV